MKLFAAAVLVAAVGFSCASEPPEEENPKHEWHELMEGLDDFQYDTLKTAAKAPDKVDLAAIVATARETAEELREWGGPALPGDARFSGLAAEAARWYDDVAAAAGSGAAALGTTLARFETVEKNVCNKCHDVYKDRW